MYPFYFTKSFRFKKKMELMETILNTLNEINDKLDERPIDPHTSTSLSHQTESLEQ